jgi:hypothetical protein
MIIISGGAIQQVTKPTGIQLEIHDYDIEASDIPEGILLIAANFLRQDAGAIPLV